MPILDIDQDGIKVTLNFLKKAGRIERVVLWLAEKRGEALVVKEVYVPEQVADFDYFHIPRKSIADLLKHLRRQKLVVSAQVHTHPARAFHSEADDRWAIIRHIGGLSLVLPHFASTTSVNNFVANAAVFELSQSGKWLQIPQPHVASRYRIIFHEDECRYRK